MHLQWLLARSGATYGRRKTLHPMTCICLPLQLDWCGRIQIWNCDWLPRIPVLRLKNTTYVHCVGCWCTGIANRRIKIFITSSHVLFPPL
ncbi:hypothetical protein AX14_013962 [Amanita brunnescens Koide BX004]|nr:hypothetical protein AX14_013962 [Amanita brunnescens Koide BX004]